MVVEGTEENGAVAMGEDAMDQAFRSETGFEISLINKKRNTWGEEKHKAFKGRSVSFNEDSVSRNFFKKGRNKE